MTRSLASRTAAVALLSLLIVGVGAPAAVACPDHGDVGSISGGTSTAECPLRRIDTQFVRCDNLTGAGVPAPLFIPELEPLATPGPR